MFGIGGSEIFTIVLVALLVFGPKQIPIIARTIKKALREFNMLRDHMRSTMDEVRREIDIVSDVREELNEVADLGLKPASGTAQYQPASRKPPPAAPARPVRIERLDDYLSPAEETAEAEQDDYLAGGAA